jgi:hypothetical protein
MDTGFSAFVREVLRFWIRSSSVCQLRSMLEYSSMRNTATCKPIRVLRLDYGERLDLAKISVICSPELTQPVIETLSGSQATDLAVCKVCGGRLTKERYANISVTPLHGFLGF